MAASPSRSRLLRSILLVAAVAAGCLTSARPVQAEGNEFSVRTHDLILTIDSRWTGCRYGGYYPIRIRATNTAAARNFTFVFSPEGDSRALPPVERTVGLEQNATVQFTLSIPMVTPSTGGKLTIYHQGRPLEKATWGIAMSDSAANQVVTPALLILSDKHIDTNSYQLAAEAVSTNGMTDYRRMASLGYGGGYSSANVQSLVLAPNLLPESWIDYSGLDVVALSAKTLTEMPPAARTAMLQWVETGGTLVVSEAGDAPEKSEVLRKGLGLDNRTAAPWKAADIATIPQHVRNGETIVVPQQEAGMPQDENVRRFRESNMRTWTGDKPPFWTRDLMQGKVIAVEKDLFQAKPGDWQWLLKSIGPEVNWPTRHGFSSRALDDEFLNFEIPGLQGVPVTAMLVMITLFAIAIGPVNYFILWKRRRLGLLIFTIPAIAFLTSLSLFAYSTFSHGFGTKSRTRSLTLLDQTAHTAVTTTRLSLFAGLAPSSGLKFSPETAVYTIWHAGSDPFQTGRVDWTNTQSLESGWLRSRTRTQFVTERHRTERGRLVIKPLEGTMLPIENGFEWDIVQMIVVDENGKRYVGSELAAGAATRLKEISGDQELSDFSALIAQQLPRMPEGAANYNSGYNSGYGRAYRMYGNEAPSFQFAASQMEKTLDSLSRTYQKGSLPPRSYALILRDNPGIEKGVEHPNERAPLHVLIGKY